MDYALPRADELPFVETVLLEHTSPRNPLEVKGVGEGGAISPPAALANAVEDALAPFGVRITEGPGHARPHRRAAEQSVTNRIAS
jgi:aerobic carbon-monoxide dehydrogenase large subunit